MTESRENKNQMIILISKPHEFIIKIQKLFKIKLFQLNVNSCFDDSNLKPFNIDCVVDTVKTLNNLNIPENVR